MKLSVVIVNYNVKYFLEQAILSLQSSCKNVASEIFVVDNCSKDGSTEMIKQKFPSIKLIENKSNVGFSKANNQAILASKGEYVLLVNPDTIIAEDTIEKCLLFMEKNHDAGALGVKMIDGTSVFLPESKRALPTPWISFCKIFGLSALFPNSRLFAQYHLGYLPMDATHEVGVLSGAFMFMRKAALDKSGLLDETFFMYGEDIDLSYRIKKAGYKNYYFADTTILHYKGESTKKGSINYVKAFYEAMIIYAKKHFSHSQAGIYTFIIQLAIYTKAFFSLLSRVFKIGLLPVFDFVGSFVGIYFLKELWENKIMHNDDYYSTLFVFLFMPLYVLVWLFFSFVAGAYDKPIRAINIIKGVGFGTLVLTAVFGILPNEFRFSRAIILMGAIWVAIAFFMNRMLYQFFNKEEVVFKEDGNHKIVIVGDTKEGTRVLTLLNESGIQFTFVGFVAPTLNNGDFDEHSYLSNLSSIEKTCVLLNINEIVFCNKNVLASKIIETMLLVGLKVSYKTVPEDSNSIIGSNSKNTSGDLYAIDSNLKIGRTIDRRNKRFFDITLSLIFVCFLPVYLFVFKKSILLLIQDLGMVVIGKKTWVAYLSTTTTTYSLPLLKPGVFKLIPSYSSLQLSDDLTHKMNLFYAREYSVYKDLSIVCQQMKFVRKQIAS